LQIQKVHPSKSHEKVNEKKKAKRVEMRKVNEKKRVKRVEMKKVNEVRKMNESHDPNESPPMSLKNHD
jgi:hypothetical protein